jgi:enamine deaminase RidA (YjgF/YER057c/UK114 family)
MTYTSHQGGPPCPDSLFRPAIRSRTSTATRARSGLGDQVFVSGTTARPPHLDGDAHAQARAALDLVADGLAQAGAEMRHVVRTVVYVVDMADALLVAQAHLEVFGQVRPASTLVQVAALTPAAARVEVEATAVIAD